MNLANHDVLQPRVEKRLSFSATLGLLLLLWAGYTALQTLFLVYAWDESLVSVLELLPGLLGIGVLLRAGFSKDACYLRLEWPSWKGLLALGVFFLLWPVILSTGRFTGWDWRAALTQGVGGVSQELFFRAALLPVMVVLFKYRTPLALGVHAVLFAIWHTAAFLLAPPELIAGPIAIVSISLIAGLVWGWQTIHDRTVLWAMIHHGLLWVIGSMFYLGPP